MKIALPQFHYMVRMEKQPDPKVNEPAHNCVVTYVDGLSANDPRYEDKTAHPNWFVRKSFISPPREVTGLVTHEVTDELGREYLKKTANECISLPDQLQEKEELLNMMHYCNELGRSALHLTANNCEESAAAIRSENPWMLETALENANTMMGIQQNLQQQLFLMRWM